MPTIHEILKRDEPLRKEINEILDSGDNLPVAKRNNVHRESVMKAMIGPVAELPRSEAMIRLHMRPALLVKNNKVLLPDSSEVRNRFLPFKKKIEHVLPAIGRIEFVKAGRKFGGTGWMITEDLIVTNRHVAALVTERSGKVLRFKKNALGDTIEVLIDFKEEYFGPEVARPEFEVEIEKAIYMTTEAKSQPDLAFLQIKKNTHLAAPIPIVTADVKERQFVSVIGYPAYDPGGIISEAAAKDVFNDIYEVKRCSPGEVIENVKNAWYFFHDCTTLGGNSGSAVIDNESGAAVGLHFMGELEEENYAVKGAEIIKHLRKIKPQIAVPAAPKKKQPVKESKAHLELPPESYDDRQGFNAAFLGSGAKLKVALPTVKKGKTNVLTFKTNGKTVSELKYHHFSVVMNKERRQCFFSACNIDGETSKRGVKRTGWKFDSRIPVKMQIKDECYGNAPKFSRGHMTRKEDPIWGEIEMARDAAADTFHVTNATPQMQLFNAPVWLALEDYALENSRQDDMRISVITGPVFTKDDPTKFGVRIPVEFFKIIAFIHDDTGDLCATGYTVSQADNLRNEEFVFGEFETYQIPIKTIEKRTGLSFGRLSDVDPIKGEEATGAPLSTIDEVRFV